MIITSTSALNRTLIRRTSYHYTEINDKMIISADRTMYEASQAINETNEPVNATTENRRRE